MRDAVARLWSLVAPLRQDRTEWHPHFIAPADDPVMIDGRPTRGAVERRIINGEAQYRMEPEEDWLARQF